MHAQAVHKHFVSNIDLTRPGLGQPSQRITLSSRGIEYPHSLDTTSRIHPQSHIPPSVYESDQSVTCEPLRWHTTRRSPTGNVVQLLFRSSDVGQTCWTIDIENTPISTFAIEDELGIEPFQRPRCWRRRRLLLTAERTTHSDALATAWPTNHTASMNEAIQLNASAINHHCGSRALTLAMTLNGCALIDT